MVVKNGNSILRLTLERVQYCPNLKMLLRHWLVWHKDQQAVCDCMTAVIRLAET